MITGVFISGNDLIRGVAFSGCGLITGIAFGWSGLIREVAFAGLDINVCPIPVKTVVGQVDLVLRLSDETSEKVRFPNVPVRRTYIFPLV